MARSEVPELEIATSNVPYLMSVIKDTRAPKSYKQAALRRIRQIERDTGRSIYGSYNGASRNSSEMARVEEEGHA